MNKCLDTLINSDYRIQLIREIESDVNEIIRHEFGNYVIQVGSGPPSSPSAFNQRVSVLGDAEVLPVRSGQHLRVLHRQMLQQRRGAFDRSRRRHHASDDHRRNAVEQGL